MIYKTHAKVRQTLGTFAGEGSSSCWYGLTSRDRVGADLPLNVSLARDRVKEKSSGQSILQHKQVGLGSLRSGDFVMNAAGI
jgi:hypothetical protein